MKQLVSAFLMMFVSGTMFAGSKSDKLKSVTCIMKQVNQPKKSVKATAKVDDENSVGNSDSLAFKGGAYSFSITATDGIVNVVIDESNHVQDEVGSFYCDLEGVKPKVTFCKEPIEASGFGAEDDGKQHKAFEFSCVAKS